MDETAAKIKDFKPDADWKKIFADCIEHKKMETTKSVVKDNLQRRQIFGGRATAVAKQKGMAFFSDSGFDFFTKLPVITPPEIFVN
jgi:hypothetical protein